MARKAKRGGGDMDAQITSLEKDVKPKGVRAANQIVDGNDPNVVKLAFKYVRKREKAGAGGLGSRSEILLSQMPTNEQKKMREQLLKAKSKL